jgi:hypothetical protein
MPNATITVNTDWDLAYIAEQAGSSEIPMLIGDQLTIYGVEQAAADAALAAYDHEARMVVVKWYEQNEPVSYSSPTGQRCPRSPTRASSFGSTADKS